MKKGASSFFVCTGTRLHGCLHPCSPIQANALHFETCFWGSLTFNWHPQQIAWTQCKCYVVQEMLRFLHYISVNQGSISTVHTRMQWELHFSVASCTAFRMHCPCNPLQGSVQSQRYPKWYTKTQCVYLCGTGVPRLKKKRRKGTVQNEWIALHKTACKLHRNFRSIPVKFLVWMGLIFFPLVRC